MSYFCVWSWFVDGFARLFVLFLLTFLFVRISHNLVDCVSRTTGVLLAEALSMFSYDILRIVLDYLAGIELVLSPNCYLLLVQRTMEPCAVAWPSIHMMVSFGPVTAVAVLFSMPKASFCDNNPLQCFIKTVEASFLMAMKCSSLIMDTIVCWCVVLMMALSFAPSHLRVVDRDKCKILGP